MKFAHRIALALFLVSAGLLTLALVLTARFVTRKTESDFVSRYQTYSAHIANTFVELERTTSLVLSDALYVLREKERTGGLLTNAQLMRLKKDLGVEAFFITDSQGRYLASDYYLTVRDDPALRAVYRDKPPLTKPLFEYCPDYRGLVEGTSQIEETPFIPSGTQGFPFKFAMAPNHNRTRVLETNMPMNFVGQTLRNVVASETAIRSIGLYTPTGRPLGFVEASHQLYPKISAPSIRPEEITFDKPTITANGYLFSRKVVPPTGRCCECVRQGLAAADGSYYYVLQTLVSRSELDARLATIRNWFIAFLVGGFLLSYGMARLIARALVRRLEQMSSAIRQATQRKSFHAELRVDGSDEIGQLAGDFRSLLGSLRDAQAEIVDTRREAAIGDLARQVAHDIRSPLAALASVTRDLSGLPERPRDLVRTAISRIQDIANGLLERTRASQGELEPQAQTCLLAALVDSVIGEVRIANMDRADIQLDADHGGYGLFIRVEPSDFKRVLSNVINNAVEASDKGSTIVVRLRKEDCGILIEVEDRGRGIPSEVLSKLGQRGATFGKPTGSGLGLYHAKSCAEGWGGSFEISSVVGTGTTVRITLPATAPPPWFVSQLETIRNAPVVVLDDDPTIHQIWQGRFDSQFGHANMQVVHCSSSADLRRWVRENADKVAAAVYLLDCELRSEEQTGLTLAEELKLGRQAILVTSRYEDKTILEECVSLGVRLIPKGLAGFVPIVVTSGGPSLEGKHETPDAVLVDDDPLVHEVWRLAAAEHGKNLCSFATASECLAAVEAIDRSTPVYVDSRLGAERGEDLAKRLHERGFSEIYLATGQAPDGIETQSWIRAVVGKSAPWS